MIYGFNKKTAKRIETTVKTVEAFPKNNLGSGRRPTGRLDKNTKFFRTKAGPDTEPYPIEDDEPNVYYAVLQKSIDYVKTAGQQGLASEDTQKHVHIYNLGSAYIPENEIVPCFRIGKNYFCDYGNQGTTGAEIRRCILDETLTDGGNAQATIYQFITGTGWEDAEIPPIVVHDAIGIGVGNDVPAGATCVAAKDSLSDVWLAIAIECVEV